MLGPFLFVRCLPALVGALLAVVAAAQTGLAGSLVANDTAFARWSDSQTGAVTIQSHPAGVLTSTNLNVGLASYSCNLTQGASGVALQAATFVTGQSSWTPASTHADVTLTLTAPTGTVVAIELELSHFGDSPSSGGFTIDVGDDGSIEADTSCSCASPRVHRLWTWDSSMGPLPIRVRTNQGMGGGGQWYFLSLQARSWVGYASPISPGFAGIAAVTSPSGVYRESTNYQLAAMPPAQPLATATLRAVGLGQFGAFVIADQPTMSSLQLPLPFVNSCNVLNSVLFLDPGVVSATLTIGVQQPRQWDLHVPTLPPGLFFFVQHASAEPSAPFWFGATNVLRFDT